MAEAAAVFGAEDSLFPAAFLIISDGRDGGYFDRLEVFIDCYESHISDRCLDAGLLEGVFADDLHPDLHAGAVGVVDHRPEDDLFADMDGAAEGDRVDGSRHAGPLAVPLGRHRGHHVNPGENDATENRAVRIGVIGHDKVAAFDAAL
jgi:hypothetical protein